MRSRELRFGLGVFVASLGLLLVRFLVPRPIGMADNGDGWRLLCKLGGRQLDRPSESWVRFSYAPAPPCRSEYVSSQTWLDLFASKLGHLLGSHAALNLLLLGLITCVIVAAGVTATVLGLDLSRRNQVIAAALLLLLIADSAFFGYFASVLSEGAAFLGMLFIVGGLLLMHRRGPGRYAGAAVTVAGGLVGINAKSQTLLLIPLFVLALLLVRPRGIRGLARWALPLAVLAVVGAGTWFMQAEGDSANAEYREANVYHVIFDSIVDGKHDTQGDLAALGLPPEFAKYVGTGWWADNAAWHDPAYGRYRDQISRRNVVHYYVTHPVRTLEILQQSAKDTLAARPARLGSFGERSGQPAMSKEYRVPVLSGLSALLSPLGFFALIPIWLLIGWGGIRALRRGKREYGTLVFLLLLFAIGQFGLSALGEGVEGVKHQLLTLFPTLFAALLAGISLLPRKPDDKPESLDTAQETATVQLAAVADPVPAGD